MVEGIGGVEARLAGHGGIEASTTCHTWQRPALQLVILGNVPHYFGNSAEFWINLQAHYDLKLAKRNLRPKDARQIKTRRAA